MNDCAVRMTKYAILPLGIMAPMKRKNDSIGQHERPGKRTKPPADTTLPILKEEAPFPRGGASVLTPIEHKQITIQAEKDFLFEQNTGKKTPRNDYGAKENEDAPDAELSGTTRQKQPKKGKVSQKHRKSVVESGRQGALRVESLGFKACIRVTAGYEPMTDHSSSR